MAPIRVCFLHYGGVFEEIAKVMIASVREHMPNAIVTQLTDMASRKVPGVDELRRHDGKMYQYLLGRHMADCPLPFIRLDYDMIVQGDLSHILDGEHELAFNLHGDENVINSEYGRRSPIAGSVSAFKTHRFAVDLRRAQIESGLDDWLGALHVHNEVARRYSTLLLDGRIYNYTPKDREDRPADALVIHYKGLRKHWMVPPEMEARARIDERRISDNVKQYRDTELLKVGYGPTS